MSQNQKIALITGGGQGIGKAIVRELSDAGCKPIIVDVDEKAAKSTARELEGDYFIADVSNTREVEETVKEIIEKYNKIDILINNAGITQDNYMIRMKEKEWDSVIGINLKGVFNFSQKVVRHSMLKAKTGSIVNIASVVGIIGNPGQANYSASKGGVISLTKTMAKEFAGRNIRVNAVAPGFIKTKMTEELPDKVKEGFLKNIPLNRLGLPEEVAKTVRFLALDNSSYITGQVINIDGGLVTG
ncbi:MAG: 3-oxoacyl-[acyl-carrier-protein] reductase [Elusimicrobiota bacterium]